MKKFLAIAIVAASLVPFSLGCTGGSSKGTAKGAGTPAGGAGAPAGTTGDKDKGK